MEAFYLVVTGEMPFWHFLDSFILPMLTGNIIGGVTMVAILAHAQFMASGKAEHSRTSK